MQNVLHYSPLQTGIRFLPSTLVIIVMGPLAGRLTDRVGARPLIAAGLALVATALGIQSTLTVHSGYGLLLPGFILMGLGMGLVMSPMSTAAMNAVDRSKAGAASGVLSMSRMVGGSVGLAIMGALVTTIGRSDLTSSLPNVPAAVRAKIASALGSGAAPTGQHTTPTIVSATHHAFVSALGTGLEVGAIVAVIGAVLTWVLISPREAAPTVAVDDATGAAELPVEIAA
jgi:MFS family permease